MALNRYAGMTDLERSQIVLPPGLTLATLEANREKVLPYTNSEIAFIVPVLGSVARSSGAPGILVGSLNIQLKRRVPLLSRLAVRARVTSLDGKRIGVTAEIFGKKTTRLTALEKDESGGWEGEWDVLLARGTGTCIVMYDMGLIIGKGTAAPKGGAKM